MWYAKSEYEEDIRTHTDNVIKNYEILKDYLTHENLLTARDWQLLKFAVEYHDLGKFDLMFQNNIYISKGKKTPYPIKRVQFIPHNFLSVALVPFEDFNLTEEEEKLLIQSIGYHHERDVELNIELIINTINEELIDFKNDMETHMKFKVANEPQIFELYELEKNNRITPYGNQELFTKYVLLKGLLHRLDHSASAYLDVEIGIKEDISEYVNRFFKKRPTFEKRPLQIFAEKNQNKHVIAIAQTGMGKTEAALLWSGNKKTFFTLPLRVSLNAMYLRVIDENNIGFPKQYAGLLHSTSLDVMEEKYEENAEMLQLQSRHLSSKLLFTTIDQILKFPFYYKGFEKELSAMAGAKVVIDEMQSYDPKIAAMLIRALEMIDQVGGSFMIITATLPLIYQKAIEENSKIQSKSIVSQKFYDDTSLRHYLEIREESIMGSVDEIIQKSNSKKILVICNTVQRAKDVYKSLDDNKAKVRLLHSLYMPIHRQELERQIMGFSDDENQAGIWVTTQLVEASLDIDFDELHTELSVLDSQFQRYGRCYRKRVWKRSEPNVFVYTEDISDNGFIYPDELMNTSLDLLRRVDGKMLKESEKMEMVETLYSEENLKGTKFLDDFLKTQKFFSSNQPYEINQKEAQAYLRNIQNIKVLPFYNGKVEDLIEEYNQSTGENRFKVRRKIEQHAISVNKYRVRDLIHQSGMPPNLKDLFFIESKYEFDEKKLSGQGLIIEKIDFYSH